MRLTFGLDVQEEQPIRFMIQHPSFQTICLQREVLEIVAIVGLSQLRGIRAQGEMNNMYVNK